MKLHRTSKIDSASWGIRDMQTFFPSLEMLFKTESLSSLSGYAIKLNEEIESVIDSSTIKTTKKRIVPVHRKTTMVLSPFKTMRGDYGSFGLPKHSDLASEIQDRIQSPHTAAYVGALASIALSESACVHFPKVFGVYVGMAQDHVIDISDDFEDLTQKGWFADNIGKTFELKLRKGDENDSEFTHTRRQRVALGLGEEIELDGVEDIHPDHVSNPSASSNADGVKSESGTTIITEDSGSSGSDDVFDIESCDCGDEDDEDDIDEEDDEEPFAWATFHNIPVVTTVMEVCEGTFYDLIEKHVEPEKHVAWVTQMTFALAFAQRVYGFTHNDLHGNNVMYVSTDQEYVYYKHSGVCYRVPTYGYIIKIIDFDRGILSLRLNGMKDSRTFVSSQFEPEEEAGGQYNMEPFFDQSKQHIPANAGFDLCRFATSLFWDMFPEGPDHPYTHPLFDVFKQWMMFSDGTSALFREKRDNHDRYHGFHLYKAIARYSKDAAIPRREIIKLTHFRVDSIPIGSTALFIES